MSILQTSEFAAAPSTPAPLLPGGQIASGDGGAPAGVPRISDLKGRYAALHREMVDQVERTVAVEHHWLIYTLLGWEHLATCIASHYLVEVAHVQYPHRWIYPVLWLAQTLVAFATIRLIRGRPRIEESPLKPIINRVWAIFFLLCCNVAVLNAVAGLPVFVFLPVLGTLSSFAFLVLASIVSRRFLFAGLFMFATGLLIAHFPAYGFLLYGFAWLIVLQTLGVIFLRRRKLWLTGARPVMPTPDG